MKNEINIGQNQENHMCLSCKHLQCVINEEVYCDCYLRGLDSLGKLYQISYCKFFKQKKLHNKQK